MAAGWHGPAQHPIDRRLFEAGDEGFEVVAGLRAGRRDQAILIQAASDVVGDRGPGGALKLCSRKTPGRRVTTILRADDQATRDVIAPRRAPLRA
jgi:hypothetical protein